MNIFVTYECPIKSARYLDDKRVNKMLLESVQLMSTALHCLGSQGPYRPTHVNHPCAVWTRETLANYLWVHDHAKELAAEYTRRTGKVHKCSYLLRNLLTAGLLVLPAGHLTAFVNCAANISKGIDYKYYEDVHLAYRKYLEQRWLTDVRPSFTTLEKHYD